MDTNVPADSVAADAVQTEWAITGVFAAGIDRRFKMLQTEFVSDAMIMARAVVRRPGRRFLQRRKVRLV